MIAETMVSTQFELTREITDREAEAEQTRQTCGHERHHGIDDEPDEAHGHHP